MERVGYAEIIDGAKKAPKENTPASVRQRKADPVFLCEDHDR